MYCKPLDTFLYDKVINLFSGTISHAHQPRTTRMCVFDFSNAYGGTIYGRYVTMTMQELLEYILHVVLCAFL